MLLQSVQDADFDTYVKLTDPQITCYEPEAVSWPEAKPKKTGHVG